MKKLALALTAQTILSAFFLFTPLAVDAQTAQRTAECNGQSRETGGVFNNVSDCCIVIGECTAADFAIVSFSIARFVFAGAGVIALIFFITGGVFLLISGGNQDLITRGKQTLRAAFIGLLIIFLAWIIVNGIVWAITGNPNATIFGQAWDRFRTN